MMNKSKRITARIKVVLSSICILIVIALGTTSCNSDDQQVVAELTDLVMEEE